ncbi:hypothetical protein H5410_061701 [Solanum commersonii]|uniref:Uncharacterized protein n=1 Tax=Solanum commersonii TaxID=4109 RepID=A0A9J5W9D9_SOLCO|nr:hypothetical protein H5410_061701 [Solanum commersonii]
MKLGSGVEENVLKQKSRVNWIGGGEANTNYFHAQINIRISRNAINSIYSASWVKLQEPALVEEEFISFFSSLMGTATEDLPSPNVEVIRKDLLGTNICFTQKNLEDDRGSVQNLFVDRLNSRVKEGPYFMGKTLPSKG